MITLVCLVALLVGGEELTQREKQIEEIYKPRPQAYVNDIVNTDGKAILLSPRIFKLEPYKDHFMTIGNKEKASLYVKNPKELTKISEEVWVIRKKNLKSKEDLLKISKDLGHVYPLYEYKGNIIGVDGRVSFKIDKEEKDNIRLWLKDRKMPMDTTQFDKDVFITFISNDASIPNPFDLVNQLRRVKGIIWAQPSLLIQRGR